MAQGDGASLVVSVLSAVVEPGLAVGLVAPGFPEKGQGFVGLMNEDGVVGEALGSVAVVVVRFCAAARIHGEEALAVDDEAELVVVLVVTIACAASERRLGVVWRESRAHQ